MSSDLITLDEKRLGKLTEAMPTRKRGAYRKALEAAIQYVKDGRLGYDKAFALNREMLLNEWHLGGELPKLIRGVGQPPKNSPAGDHSVLLADLGINKNRSSRAQRIHSSFSKRDFINWHDSQYDVHAFKLPRLTQAVTETRRIAYDADELELPEGEYAVVVIDPPWPMEKIERDERPNQAQLDYPAMQEDQIADYAPPCAEDCHVWLWTTHRFLPMAFRLLGRWGLRYVCTFVWHKPGGFQPHGLPQYNCEFCLYARNGSPVFTQTKDFSVCFEAARGKHSEKPEAFYDMVRRTTKGPRLDMYNRRKIRGFKGWGNESPDASEA